MQIHKPKICEGLNGEDGIVLFGSFTFYNDTTFNKQVNSQRITDNNPFIYYGNLNLFLNVQTSLCQFVRKCVLIDRLKQSRTAKRPMHSYGCVKHFLTDVILFHLLSLCLRVSVPLC